MLTPVDNHYLRISKSALPLLITNDRQIFKRSEVAARKRNLGNPETRHRKKGSGKNEP
jgi:hypothetical protein